MKLFLLSMAWILMIGFIGPWLISAAFTPAVIGGIVLFGVLIWYTKE